MSVEADFKQEKVIHLDLHEYSKVEHNATVRQTIETMRRDRTNCALILDDGKLIGILTERDVLKKVVTQQEVWDSPITDFMTASPQTIDAHSAAESALDMMGDGKFRNVPVIDSGGNILGNVTYYAFIKFLADHFPQEIYNISPDEGIHKNRYGG